MVGVSYFRSYHLFKGMEINEAQVKAIADGFLAKLGQQKSSYEKLELNVIETILYKYGKKFVLEANKNIKKSNIIAGGSIANISSFVIKKFATDYTLSLGYTKDEPASKYYDFINKGVKGVGGKNVKAKNVSSSSPYAYKTPYPNKKMATSILKWYRLGKAKTFGETRTNTLNKSQNKSRKLKEIVNKADSLKALAYATASAIKRDGLKTTSYFDNARDTTFGKDFLNIMTKALGEDVKISITQSFYGDNNTK